MAKRNVSPKSKSRTKNASTASVKQAVAVATLPSKKVLSVDSRVKKVRKAAPPPVLNFGSSHNLQRSAKPETPAISHENVEQRGIEAVPSTYIDRGLPIPEHYGMDRLVALVRDPRWIYSYWELRGSILPDLKARRGQAFIDACAWVLRLHRISEGVAVDMEIDPGAGTWYINVGGHGKYQVELGLLAPDGEWISLLASYIIETPRTGPSDVVDDEWAMRPEDEELLGLADAAQRGTSGLLGTTRLQSSFALASSMMLGSSASGRPVAGSWAFSFLGASRVSSSGSGGFGWMLSPAGVLEPMLERPGNGPNWNAQPNLPVRGGKSHLDSFSVKLPRTLSGLPLPSPSWPPSEAPRSAPRKKRAMKTEKARA